MPKRTKKELDLMDIFAEYSPQRMSNGQIRMECPFRDKHPDGSGKMSFFVSPDMNAYHCFAGETRVPTSNGTFLIKDLGGKSAKVLSSNGEFVSAKFNSFGKQQLWELRLTRDGVDKVIRTTSGHRWYIHGVKGTTITENLKVGQYLQTVDFSHCMESSQSLMGIRHGIIFGDGTLDTGRSRIKSLVNLHGVKMQLASFFSERETRGLHYRKTGEPYIRIYHVRRRSKFKDLPHLNAKLPYIRGFLAGYVATDGCFTKQGLLLLASSKYGHLDFCKQAFYRLGISTGTIHYQMRKGYGSADTPLYFLMIKTTNLDPSFFIRDDQRKRFLSYRKKYERNRWRIVSIEKTDIVEEVYCAEVPKYHSFALEDNILTGNCFSCKSHGNLVRLLTTKFKVNYFDAVGMVRLTDYKPEKKEFDLDLMWNINETPKEFLRRGYTPECLRHFRVGTTEDGSILIPYYRDFNSPTDLLGYQKRWYKGKDRRVKNSKGFEKRNYLYNLDDSYSYVVLVEGQSDVWRLYQYGYNACALMGSDISDWQIKELSKFDRVYLALDNDEAGRRGIEICNHFLKNLVEVFLVPYESKDPGECSQEDWVEAFENKTDYVVYSLEMSIGWDKYLDMRDEVIRELKYRDEK